MWCEMSSSAQTLRWTSRWRTRHLVKTLAWALSSVRILFQWHNLNPPCWCAVPGPSLQLTNHIFVMSLPRKIQTLMKGSTLTYTKCWRRITLLSVKRKWQKMLCRRECTLSASWTSQICSPVAGLQAGKTFPLTESCHSLLMKICREENAGFFFRWNDGFGSWRQREVILQPYSNWFHLKQLSLSERSWLNSLFFSKYFYHVKQWFHSTLLAEQLSQALV